MKVKLELGTLISVQNHEASQDIDNKIVLLKT